MNRVSARELQRLADRLTPRRRQLLEAVAVVRVASADQLRRRFYDGPRASASRLARMDLARLHEQNILHRFGHQVGGRRAGSSGYTYALGPVGRRLLDLLAGEGIAPGRSRYEPTVGFIEHALAVTEVWVALHEHLTHPWTGEPNVSVEYRVEAQTWRPYVGEHGRTLTLKPDAEVHVLRDGFEDRWWIEVDRGTEHRPALARKLQVYLDYFASGREQHAHGVFPLTAWLATTDARVAVIRSLIDELPPAGRRLFHVAHLSAAAPTLLSLGRSEP